MRFDAYYYGFKPTGVEAIDRILSAVACAGKAYHHTDGWMESCHHLEPELRGGTPAEWIQNAAEDAARELKRKPDQAPDDYCDDCYNTGSVECLCGGDGCACAGGQMPCEACS